MAKDIEIQIPRFKHIFGPEKGYMTNMPPTYIPREASPYMKGVYLKDGVVSSDYGYTKFPSQGAQATNKLDGSVMWLGQYYKLDGQGWLLALTTTNAYKYNESTGTWDNITQGTEVSDCESAWTSVIVAPSILLLETGDSILLESGDKLLIEGLIGSSTSSSYKLKGTYSAKMAIANGFTTGGAAYEDFGSSDLTGYTAVHFWIRSSVATSAGDLQLLLDDTSGCASPLETLDVPALVADQWTSVCVDIGTPASLSAVISVGLNIAVDNGAQDVYIDDVRAVVKHTGDEDNRFSTATLHDTFTYTNGIDQPQKITESGGVLTAADLGTSLATGTISTAELTFAFKDHLFLMNNTENAADAPQRVSWSNIGDIEDWTNGTAGYQDLVEAEDWIMAVEALSENEFVIYKERSIVIGMWVGGQTPFRFYVMVSGTGALNKECVTNVGGEHVVLGPDVLFTYKGEKTTEVLDDPIKKTMYGVLNKEYADRAYMMYVEEDDELQICIPTSSVYPDDIWCINMVKENWYRKDRTMTGFGYYQRQSSLTIGDLEGTIGDQNWRFGDALTKAYAPINLVGNADGEVFELNKNTLNNDGTAIVNEFQTPDFVLPDTKDFLDKYMRVGQFVYEASGTSVTTFWSEDGGSSWHPTEGAGVHKMDLDSIFKYYQQDFDATVRKIRFKFCNEDVSSGFNVRYYGFRWLPRSGRQ